MSLRANPKNINNGINVSSATKMADSHIEAHMSEAPRISIFHPYEVPRSIIARTPMPCKSQYILAGFKFGTEL
jgi:hypothetical protein